MDGDGKDGLLALAIERLVDVLHPEKVYLFGSRARGDHGEYSDVDLLVIVPESDLPGYARDRIALRALRGIGMAVDVLVFTKPEFDRKLAVACSLPATVHREGRLLYAA